MGEHDGRDKASMQADRVDVLKAWAVYYLLKCFTIVVLGGLGNPIGAFLGGIVLGLAESYTSLFATYAISPAIAFIGLILILLFRPSGILGTLR